MNRETIRTCPEYLDKLNAFKQSLINAGCKICSTYIDTSIKLEKEPLRNIMICSWSLHTYLVSLLKNTLFMEFHYAISIQAPDLYNALIHHLDGISKYLKPEFNNLNLYSEAQKYEYISRIAYQLLYTSGTLNTNIRTNTMML